jgi:hypothetical protein
MSGSILKDLYNSSNGDRWALGRNDSGALVVIHYPNKSSGGRRSEIAVDVFLSHGGGGPEYQALERELALLGHQHSEHTELLPAEIEKLSSTLGEAVARSWSNLPQEIQQELFEAAVKTEGEVVRQRLAIYLHGRHERTVEALQSKAIPTPDSPGG